MRQSPTRRWSHVIGNAISRLGVAAYLLAFVLPAWQTERIIYSGLEAFLWAPLVGGAAGLIAWCANPLFWIALLARRAGWPVTTFVLSASAITLAIAGSSIFAADHLYITPWGGHYVWIAGMGTAGIGMLLGLLDGGLCRVHPMRSTDRSAPDARKAHHEASDAIDFRDIANSMTSTGHAPRE